MTVLLNRTGRMYGYSAGSPSPLVLDAGSTVINPTGSLGITSFDSVTHGSGQFTVSAGTNRLLVVFAAGQAYSGGNATLSATFGAQAMTQVALAGAGGNEQCIAFFYIKDADIPSGAQTLTITTASNVWRVHALYRVYENIDQTTPVGTAGSFDTNNTSVSTTVAATASSGDATSWMISGMSGRIHNVPVGTRLPVTVSNGSVVISDETGAATNESVLALADDAFLSTGSRTQTFTVDKDINSRSAMTVELKGA